MKGSADWLFRFSLAFAFLYPPVSAWFNPLAWIGYVPAFAFALWPWNHFLFLQLFGIVEIILALWVISGWKIWIPSGLMGLLLLAIVATNAAQIDVVFRDLSIAGFAFALAIISLRSSRAT